MTMTATVIRVNAGNLLVRDSSSGNEVLVHTRDARRFSPGNRVRITYNGAMTKSIPPQITATAIRRIQDPPRQSRPTETRAIVIQRRRGSLLVRNMSNNRQLLVHTPHAHHFCSGQRIVVKYDNIVMNNPPEVRAIDITSLC